MKWVCLLLVCLNALTGSMAQSVTLYQSATLEIDSIAPHTFVHRSWLYTGQWGKVSCNGAIYIHSHKAVVFDTPTTDGVSDELIMWIKQRAQPVAVVINHAHTDCLGGLHAFHRAKIVAIANTRTFKKMQHDKALSDCMPRFKFKSRMKYTIAGATIVLYYPGEGHTSDNIVAYIPEDKVLFGGCIIKAQGADKGNLAEANIAAWSNSVLMIKRAFPHLVSVVPGHGAYGDSTLLDYTYHLFMPSSAKSE